MNTLLKILAFCGLIAVLTFSCEEEVNDPECYDSVCLKGEILIVNYCLGPEDPYSVIIQILNPDVKLGDTLTSDPTYDNVVECYNLPPKYYLEHLDDTLYFTYRDKTEEDNVSRMCNAFYGYTHVNKGIFMLCISTKGCEYLKELD